MSVSLVIAMGGLFAPASLVGRIFAHQTALGAPLAQAGRVRLYGPWQLQRWRTLWSARYPRPFAAAALIEFSSLLLACLAAFAIAKPKATPKPFGLDAWAGFADAKRYGLFAATGIVLGKLEGEILCFNGAGHQVLIGPSRSGKGRGQVVPTLLSWPQSALVLDVKGELADGDQRFGFPGAAGFRESLGPVLRFAPTRQDGARFNPLFEVRKGANEVRDVQNLVEILIDPAGEARHQDFWDKSAKSVLVGVVLHVLYAEPLERKTLSVVRETLRNLDAAAERMKTTLHRFNPVTGAPETHPEILHAAESFLAGEERVQSGIKATAESFFGLFADEIVAANTAASDFRVADLMCADKPVTLYLQPPPSDVARLMPLMRLLINQIARALMEDQHSDAQGRDKRHRLLLVLDEFPLLGRMPFFETMMGAMAGYGLQAFLVCQSLNHLTRAYGRDNVILDNCQLVSVFGAADPETAKRISDMAGDAWEWRPSLTERRPAPIIGMTRGSKTEREERRALISAGEVRALAQDEALVFVTGVKPLRASRLKFDRERVFRARLAPAHKVWTPLTTGHDWTEVRALRNSPASNPARVRSLLAAPLDPQTNLFARARAQASHQAPVEPGADAARTDVRPRGKGA